MNLRSSKRRVTFEPVPTQVYIRAGMSTRNTERLKQQAVPAVEPHRELKVERAEEYDGEDEEEAEEDRR